MHSKVAVRSFHVLDASSRFPHRCFKGCQCVVVGTLGNTHSGCVTRDPRVAPSHCKNKLVVLTTEWLPWLQSSCGYESYTLVTG